MSNYEQMKKIERVIVCSLIAFVAVVAVVVYSFIALGSARRRNAEQEALIASLSERKTRLEQNVAYLENSDEYLEELARNRFGMVKQGESTYIYD